MSMALNIIGVVSLFLVIVSSIKIGVAHNDGDAPVAELASLFGALVIMGSYAYLKDIF